ncbi:MAG: sigma-54 dependent transcriptional regulator [Pirellulaceae bacterium]|nr:sigma-54 dependent transcriptional regulator [Pirellulaceae bacterium]
MKILIADDESNARYGMAKALKRDGRQIIEAENGKVALELIYREHPHLVFLDIHMPELDGMELLAELQRNPTDASMEIIVVTANDSIANAIECIRRGAADFLAKPFNVEHLRAIATRTEQRVQLEQRVNELQERSEAQIGFGRLLGSSAVMRKLFSQIPKAAKSHLPVLIRGESGTGKELVARELHERSDRADQPFVAVNTASIAETLIESELFGHVKGAFTGADRPREGVFRKAHRGTLFLDEIGDMPTAVQTRLLRVLQEGIVQPVGSEEGVQVDVRVISATHQDLEQQIVDKLFRQDLYFRLRGIELKLPALRNRIEDILLLANRLLGDQHEFSKAAIAAMLSHPWPGNVRELKQRVESSLAMSDDAIISPQDLGLVEVLPSIDSTTFQAYFDLPLTEAKNRLVEDFERAAIDRAIEQESGNVSAAARRLGIHRQNLQQKMKQLGMRDDDASVN